MGCLWGKNTRQCLCLPHSNPTICLLLAVKKKKDPQSTAHVSPISLQQRGYQCPTGRAVWLRATWCWRTGSTAFPRCCTLSKATEGLAAYCVMPETCWTPTGLCFPWTEGILPGRSGHPTVIQDHLLCFAFIWHSTGPLVCFKMNISARFGSSQTARLLPGNSVVPEQAVWSPTCLPSLLWTF